MNTNSRDSYLETEILTATPQRLRKMLLDGAIRFSTLARDAFAKGDDIPAHQALDRCSEIIGELLAAVRPADDLTRKIAGVYVFLISQIVEIRKTHEPKDLDDLIEVLEIERETWKQVCASNPDRQTVSVPSASEIGSAEAEEILSSVPLNSGAAETLTSSTFELDA